MVVRQMDGEHVDRVFAALGDATRRDILRRAALGEHSVSALARHYPMSFAAVQKHVAVLERAQLVVKRKDGRAQRVAGNPEAIRKANRLLAAFEERWLVRVARLDELLATSSQGDSHARRRDPEGHQSPDHEGRRPVRRPRRQGVGRLR